MKLKYCLFLILLLSAQILVANNWTGSYYTSNLKLKAAGLEKKDPTAAFEHYLELAHFYKRQKPDSVKYFLAKSLSVSLLSNDNDLIAIAWLMDQDYLGKKGNPTAIANAKQYASINNNAMLKCLVELYVYEDSISQKLLEKADKLLISNEKGINKANQKEQLIFVLLQAERANAGFSMNSGYKFPSDITVGLNIAKAKGFMNCYMTLLSSYSMFFSSKGNFAEALKLAVEYKEQAKKLDNIIYYQAGLSNVAQAAYESKKYDVVEKECNELISLALSDRHRKQPYSQNKFTEAFNVLFMSYCEQKKFDKALIAIEKCIYYSDSLAKLHYYEDSLMAIDARLNLGVFYSFTGDEQKASNQFIEIVNKYGDKLDYVTKATLYTNIGNSNVVLGKYAFALKYLNLAQPIIQDLGIKSMATFCLAKRDAFRGLKQYDSALFYYDYYLMAHDSLYNLENQQDLADITEKYNNEKLLAENKYLENEAEMNKTKEILYLILLGFGIVLVVVGIVVFRNQRVLKQKQESLFKAEKDNLAIQLQAKEAEEEKYKVDLELKKAREKEILAQLEFKARETTSMATVALQNANLLVEIQGIIKGINGNQEENNRIMREVNALISNQKHLEAFWETFRRYFQEVHPNFFDILEERHPKLTLNDHKICAFLALGMSTNEISLLQNIENRSLLRTRQRLKEKLGLETSEEIEVYLKSLG
ncbi:MAG: helix-turn-helix transcriptional regulator [Flexibacteraceae bacterium]